MTVYPLSHNAAKHNLPASLIVAQSPKTHCQCNHPPDNYNNLTPHQVEPPLFIGLMYPHKHVLEHPVAPLLQTWETTGCPVNCGTNWSTDEIMAAIQCRVHPSAHVPPEAAAACCNKALACVVDGCCHIVDWETIQHNHSKNIKVSPITPIPHKSRAYRIPIEPPIFRQDPCPTTRNV